LPGSSHDALDVDYAFVIGAAYPVFILFPYPLQMLVQPTVSELVGRLHCSVAEHTPEPDILGNADHLVGATAAR
jgi:hypothetical protein